MSWNIFAVVSAVALTICGTSAHANLIVNGSFETDDFTGWTTTPAGTGAFSNWVVEPAFFPQPDGQFMAENPCINFCGLSQTVTTTVNGTSYDLGFFFDPGFNVENGGGEMQVFWDGTEIFDVVGGVQAWMHYSFTVTGTGNDTLLFSGFQAPSLSGVDGVTLDAAAVPGPVVGAGVPGLMLAGAVVLGWWRRKRRGCRDSLRA
jgi:hypothetical protein